MNTKIPDVGSKQWVTEFMKATQSPTFKVIPASKPLERPVYKDRRKTWPLPDKLWNRLQLARYLVEYYGSN